MEIGFIVDVPRRILESGEPLTFRFTVNAIDGSTHLVPPGQAPAPAAAPPPPAALPSPAPSSAAPAPGQAPAPAQKQPRAGRSWEEVISRARSPGELAGLNAPPEFSDSIALRHIGIAAEGAQTEAEIAANVIPAIAGLPEHLKEIAHDLAARRQRQLKGK